MVAISLSGSGEGPGGAIPWGYSTLPNRGLRPFLTQVVEGCAKCAHLSRGGFRKAAVNRQLRLC